ncbi:hypothetical protein Tco_0330034, partial [Tanacetum coccineum]
MDSEEQHNAAEVLVAISRPRGLSIPGPTQTQPQQPIQGADPKDKGKGILVEEPKKKKLTLQQIRALETTNDEEMKELYDKVRESIKDSYKDFILMGSEKERLWLQERNAKRLSRKR